MAAVLIFQIPYRLLALRRPGPPVDPAPLAGRAGHRSDRAAAGQLAGRMLVTGRLASVIVAARLAPAGRCSGTGGDRPVELARTMPMSGPTTTTEINPLRQALPRTQVPEPCAIVLFGATGDLAHRKLVPALFQLAQGGNLPSECAHRRLRPPRLDRRRPARRVREEPGQGGRRARLRRGLAPVRQPAGLRRRGRSTTRPPTRGSRSGSSELDRTHGTRGNRVYYLAVAPEFFATIIDHLGERRPDLPLAAGEPLEPGGHREAVRPRPGERPGAEPRGLARPRREPGLPDRPLPGQGDGPEHPGPAVRQHDLRADLGPPVRAIRCR